MLVGKRVWLRTDDEDAWALAEVKEHNPEKDIVTLERNTAPKGVQTVMRMKEAEFAKLMAVAGDDHLADVADLVALDDVNEPGMIHTLRLRYARNDIYTAIGPVLMAINPFKMVPTCLPEALEALSKRPADDLPPHAFTLASAAYGELIDEGHAQSILVSGESGAGKTETTKLCIRCLALVSRTNGKMAEAALESGLLLEAFGNARTVYNNNSSRFGKWMAIHFDPRGRMSACTISSYLLEQSRVVGAPPGERNYHIFYHLLAGASAAERVECRLEPSTTFKHYGYTRTGEGTSPGIDDVQLWTDVAARLDALGFTPTQRGGIHMVVAAVLMLGDMSFDEPKPGGGGPMVVTSKAVLNQAASLLRLDPRALQKTLTTRDMLVAGEKLNTHLTAGGCTDARDALAKAVYLAVFDHLVWRLNNFLHASDNDAAVGSDDDDRYIGLLDIFGFENFAVNGFEQLCINFTNEKLQQLFMDTLIRREQQEYAREGVTCAHISYPDNSAQLRLFDEKKTRGNPGGVYAMLDEEATVPNGSDAAFVEKMHAAFAKSRAEVYARPPTGSNAIGKDLGPVLSKLQFVVTHYAERVQYTAHNWLEKNRGALASDLCAVLAASDSPLISEAFAPFAPRADGEGTAKQPSVGAQFRKSLQALSATMMQTHQHFVRCLKPNGEKKAGMLEGVYVCRQLRYLGVHAVVEINRVGYPCKYAKPDFFSRYRCIAFDRPDLIDEAQGFDVCCTNLLKVAEAQAPPIARPDGTTLSGWFDAVEPLVALGKTKVFMRREVLPRMEAPRRAARGKAATCVAKYARRRIARRVLALVRGHASVVDAVITLTARPEPPPAAEGEEPQPAEPEAAAEVSWRLGQAEVRLDELVVIWEESGLRSGVSAVTARSFSQVEELEALLQAEYHQLEAEEAATLELRQALANESAKSKEAFLRLKEAIAEAKRADVGLTLELRDALAQTNAEIEKRFAALMQEWEAELLRQEEERERKRLAACSERETELLTEALKVESRLPGYRELPHLFHDVAVHNGFDTSSSTPVALLGFTPSMGVTFADDNSVSLLTHGGHGDRPGKARLHVGDVVVMVDGKPLFGTRVEETLADLQQHKYTLKVARRRVNIKTSTDTSELPTGEHSGWVQLVRASTDVRMTPLHPSRRTWMVLDKGGLTLFEEKHRGDEKTEVTESLHGSQLRVAAAQKAAAKKAAAAKRRKEGSVVDEVNHSLIHGTSEENVMHQGQKKLKQQGVLAEMADKGHHPFRVTWPGVDKVKHQLVVGAPTPAERDAWAKALESTMKTLAQGAPLRGYLMKRRGRNGGLKLGWNRRWFELLQQKGDRPPSFRYYEDEASSRDGATPKGVVVLNEQAMLLSSGQFNYKDQPHIIALSCKDDQAEGAAKATTTILGAASQTELDRWIAALQRAINSLRPGAKTELAAGATTRDELALAAKSVAQLMMQLDYMGVACGAVSRSCALTNMDVNMDMVMDMGYDKRCEDKGKLAGLILHQKQLNQIARATAPAQRGAVLQQVKKDEQRLMARTVDELKDLLDYMEVDGVPEELVDKPRLVALIMKQKHGDRVTKAIAPDIMAWRSKSKANGLLATPRGESKPTVDVD